MYFCFRFVSFCFSPVLSLTRQAHRSISVFDLVFLHLVPSLMSYINLQNMLIYMCMSYVLYTLENKTLIAVENRDGLCVRFIAAGPNWRSSTRIPNYKPATERTIFWKAAIDSGEIASWSSLLNSVNVTHASKIVLRGTAGRNIISISWMRAKSELVLFSFSRSNYLVMLCTVLFSSNHVILEEKANSKEEDNAIKSPTSDLFYMEQLTFFFFFPGKLHLFVMANINKRAPGERLP